MPSPSSLRSPPQPGTRFRFCLHPCSHVARREPRWAAASGVKPGGTGLPGTFLLVQPSPARAELPYLMLGLVPGGATRSWVSPGMLCLRGCSSGRALVSGARRGGTPGTCGEVSPEPCPLCACPQGAAQQLAADPECSWGLPGGVSPRYPAPEAPTGSASKASLGKPRGGKAAKLPCAGRALGGLRPSERVAICVFLNKWSRKRRWFWTDSSPAGAVTTCGLALWFGTRTHQPGTGASGG